MRSWRRQAVDKRWFETVASVFIINDSNDAYIGWRRNNIGDTLRRIYHATTTTSADIQFVAIIRISSGSPQPVQRDDDRPLRQTQQFFMVIRVRPSSTVEFGRDIP
ncbi:hypothetical protein KCP73_01335 [Salmonella enterica subsp. enterica]|nr:hypothetical protein KCP73_01335 [Salmonella enterica subsp. enterica]